MNIKEAIDIVRSGGEVEEVIRELLEASPLERLAGRIRDNLQSNLNPETFAGLQGLGRKYVDSALPHVASNLNVMSKDSSNPVRSLAAKKLLSGLPMVKRTVDDR